MRPRGLTLPRTLCYGSPMKSIARIVGITSLLVAAIGIVGRGVGFRKIVMADGPHAPMTFVLLGLLGLAIAIWLAVAFDEEQKGK